MPKVSPLQGNFSGGEFGSLVGGRVESDRYKTGLAVCQNYLPTVQGGLVRRPGSNFVAETIPDQTYSARLIPFIFSTLQAYMLQFSENKIRIYKDRALITQGSQSITSAVVDTSLPTYPILVTKNSHGYSNGDRIVITGALGMTQLNNREFVVDSATTNTFYLLEADGSTIVNGSTYGTYTSGGTMAKIYEVASPYGVGDIADIKYTQSADVLYLTHPSYAPRKLSRTGHTSWTLSTISLLDGPYLPTNTTTTTLTPSSFAVGTGVTVTASSTTGINGGNGFQTTDIGRSIRVKQGTTWGWAVITGRASTTSITVEIKSSWTSTAAKTDWRLGIYSGTDGYPVCVTFHEDRLFLAGAGASPHRFDGSRTGDYENFAPTDADGTVTSSHAIGFPFNSNKVNAIRWQASDEKGLLSGTTGQEWVVRPSTQGESISPTNVNAKPSTSFGSADEMPVQVGKATLFLQKGARKLREMAYFYDQDGFPASDISILANHITKGGMSQLCYQGSPLSVIWGIREDGTLLSCTYDRDLDSFKVGWARHLLGGVSDVYGTDAKVTSVAVIPSPDGENDDVWVIVTRYNAAEERTYQSVEYLSKPFEEEDDVYEAHFVDGGSTYDEPINLVFGFNLATDQVLFSDTFGAHGLTTGDRVLIRDFAENYGSHLTGNYYEVTVTSPTTGYLTGVSAAEQVPLLPAAYAGGSYVFGATVNKLVTTISGINWMEGQTVAIFADGAVRPDEVVSGGTITLSSPAAVVHFGYNYRSRGQQLRLEAGSADGTSLGKTRRTHKVGFLLFRTLGFKYGVNFDELDEVTFRTTADPMSNAVPLFSGIIREKLEADYDTENQVCWQQDTPCPGTVLAVMPQLVTQDGG